MKQYLMFLIVLFVAFPTFAQDSPKETADDKASSTVVSITERVEAAKLAYQNEASVAAKLLLKAIDAETARVEDDTRLKVETQLRKLLELKAARKAFLKNTNKTPAQQKLKSASAKYTRQLIASKKSLEKVFDDAADEYRKPPLKDFAAAARILDDKKKLFDALGKPRSLKSGTSTNMLSRKAWTIAHATNSESISHHYVELSGPAEYMLDGNPETLWHTRWKENRSPYPHEVQIDLGGDSVFSGLQYTPRKSMSAGRIKEYEIYASQDGKSWGTAIATGAFENSGDRQRITFDETKARFLRLVSLSGHGEKTASAISELHLLVSNNDNPDFFLADNDAESLDGAAGFNPEFNTENWIAASPKRATTDDAGYLQIAAGSQGNVVVTRKNNFKLPTVNVTLSASAGTDAYIIINARQKNGKWLGVTSRIRFDDGKIVAGGQRTNFREDSGRLKKYEVDEYFDLQFKIHEIDDKPEALMVRSQANSKFTGAIAYKKRSSGEAGAVGFIVNQGAISVKKFELSKEEK